jgi:uncharacterized DUF497 family protein
VRFDWDGRKATSNLLKHHVSFEDAITAYDDPFALIAPDTKHSTAGEERRWLIGESDIGVVVVVFTARQPDDTYRLISARRAGRKERTRYEEAKRIPF